MTLFDIVAKITLDSSEYEDKQKDLEKDAGKFGSKFGGVLSKGVKALGGAVVAAGKAIAGVVKKSFDAYSQYEQLVGGTRLMFGEDVAEKVVDLAQKAFSRVQMSANDYLQNVNKYATGLKVSLDGDAEAAADLADRIVTAQADVVAATGASRDAVERAFEGVMRGNYMMLDNLNLGIHATKEGMNEVIDAVNEWHAANGDAIEYQMGNFADMESALIDYIQMMGYAGYAGEEAGDTLQGSFASAKAAWDNLVMGMSDPEADIGQLIDNLIQSAGGAISNMLPVVERAITGVATAIPQLIPAITTTLNALVTKSLPQLVKAALSLIEGLAAGIKDNAEAVVDAAFEIINILVESLSNPDGLLSIIDAAFEIISQLATGLGENLPTLIPAIIGIVLEIANKLTSPENLLMIVNAALDLILGLAQGLVDALPVLLQQAPVIVQNLATAVQQAFPLILNAGIQLLLTLIQGIVKALPDWIAAGASLIPTVVEALLSMQTQLLFAGLQLVLGLVEGLLSDPGALLDSAMQIISALLDGLLSMFGDLITMGGDIVGQLIDGISGVWESLKNIGKNLIDWVNEGFTSALSGVTQWGRDLINNFISGITEKWEGLKGTVSDVAGSIKSFLGFSEPEEGPLSDFHTYAPDMMELFAKGIHDNTNIVQDELDKAFTFDAPELTVNKTYGGDSSMVAVLNTLVPILERLQAIEPGTLVGMIAPDMDTALGARQMRVNRGVA